MSQSSNSLTARSVLLSVLLGTTPPRLPVRRLVRTTELFGIAEGTTRTALSRMAAAGELTAGDGWYELAADRLLARQARQSASRAAHTAAWEGGRWVQAVVAAEGRRPPAERAALRSALSGARLAELREGVWLRPDNLGGVGLLAAQVGERGDDVLWFTAVPEGDPVDLAARLWPLGSWAEGARRLVARMAELVGPLEAGDRRPLADGFVLSADVLRHVQADPLLPAALLPAAWPGARLRTDYDRYDAAYRAVLAGWLAASDD